MFTCIFASCSDGNDEPIVPPTQNQETDSYSITLDSSIQTNGLCFESSISEKSITFTTNSDWTLTIAEPRSGAVWCTASPTSGGKGTSTVKFATTENTEPEERSVVVTIKVGTTSKTFTVVQKGIDYSEIERKALIEFYNATNGAQWDKNDNWGSDKPLDQWYGITLVNNRVSVVQLPCNKLEGEIPDSFFALSELTWINLEENKLSGNLSNKLGDLTKLTFLGLCRNNFTGNIPENISNLINLTYLSLFENKLSGAIPTKVLEMPNWEDVIKNSYTPQQLGYGLEWPATIQMIDLGDGIYMHPDGIALEYRVNELKIPDNQDLINICKNVYTKVSDSFDFIFTVCCSDQLSNEIAGYHVTVKNTIEGIDSSHNDDSNKHGSNGKLIGINVLTHKEGIYSGGPFLHELCHYWGAIDIGQELGNSTGSYIDTGHWGISDVHGQLGGFDYSTLETNVDGVPNKYRASSFTGQAWNKIKAFSQNGISNVMYAPLELYLMGLIPASEVPEMHVFKNVRTEKNDPWEDGIFYAESQETITIDDIIEKYGERIPNWTESQKDFRGLVVVLSDKKVSDNDWKTIKSDILIQEKASDDGDIQKANFWEATGGRATIKLSGIDELLKK